MSTPLSATPLAGSWAGTLAALLGELPQALRFDHHRHDALARFEALGLPGRRDEAWRFTDLTELKARSFVRAAGDRPIDADLLVDLDTPHCLSFVNGHFAAWLSRHGSLPAGVFVGSLREAAEEHPEMLAGALGRVPGLEGHALAALNGALFEDGACIYVPRGVELPEPVHLRFIGIGDDVLAQPRVLVVLEDGARAAVVEDYLGHGRYWHNAVTEIRIGAGAALEHLAVQQEAAAAWHLGALRASQSRDSHLVLRRCAAGARFGRSDIAIDLAGPGAACEIDGLALVGDAQTLASHLLLSHAVPHGSSRQHFKGVLQGKGRHVFDGLIRVAEGAVQTDAQQQSRNLLLSKAALATTVPRLEIYNDDVKCGHGATVGYLDEDAVFYLRTRGIGEADARRLLVRAFAGEFIEAVPYADLRERLERRLATYLGEGVA